MNVLWSLARRTGFLTCVGVTSAGGFLRLIQEKGLMSLGRITGSGAVFVEVSGTSAALNVTTGIIDPSPGTLAFQASVAGTVIGFNSSSINTPRPVVVRDTSLQVYSWGLLGLTNLTLSTANVLLPSGLPITVGGACVNSGASALQLTG